MSHLGIAFFPFIYSKQHPTDTLYVEFIFGQDVMPNYYDKYTVQQSFETVILFIISYQPRNEL